MSSPTIREIAKQLDVSIATVSRAINDKKGVSEVVKSRIVEHIEKNHYNPFANVSVLKKIKHKSIKVVMPFDPRQD